MIKLHLEELSSHLQGPLQNDNTVSNCLNPVILVVSPKHSTSNTNIAN